LNCRTGTPGPSSIRARVILVVAALALTTAVVPASASAGRQLDAGGAHACAVNPGGSIDCWGEQDGLDTTPPPGSYLSVSASEDLNCAIRTDATIACWGTAIFGDRDPPAGSFTSVSVGDQYACAIAAGDGSLQCWGRDGAGESSPPAGSFTNVSAGYGHGCAVRAGDGAVLCWGIGIYGQADPPAGAFTSVSAGLFTACGIRTDGSVACWGDDSFGETSPPGGSYTSVDTYNGHTCAVRTNGTLQCWGDDRQAQSSPPGGSNYVSVSVGDYFSCAVDTTGVISCWGEGDATNVPAEQASPSDIPTRLTATPGSPANDNIPLIQGAAESGSTIRIYDNATCSGESLDDGSTAEFASPGIAVQVEDDTTTTFHATATDESGTSACSTYSATYVEDSTPPTATIDSHPPKESNSTTAAFTYGSSESGSSFECSLSGVQDWGPCPASGTSFSSLIEGDQTFGVRATDRAGNVSDPTYYDWEIDLTPPIAVIDSHPADRTNSTSASFTYSADDPDAVFECSLDAADFSPCQLQGTSYSGLAAGSHDFSVRATDVAGNVSEILSFDWSIDLTAPEATIETEPADPTNETTAAFTYGASKLLSTFECKLDSGPFAPCPGEGVSYTGLGQGSHTFSVRATDDVGNTGDPVSYSWSIDLTAPVVAIDSQPPDFTRSTSASFTYSADDPDAVFECSLDGAGFSSCPATGIDYESLADGSHTFRIRAIDVVGNVGEPASFTWTVETSAPVASIQTQPEALTNSTTAAFTYGSSAPGSTFECSLDSAPFDSCPADGKDYSGLAEGPHTFRVRATDPQHLTGDWAAFTWTIDLTAPVATINSTPESVTDSTSATFTYGANESGSSFQCKFDGGGFEDCPAAGADYSGLADGDHTFSVRATDVAGNTGTAATFSWSVDTSGATYRQVSAGYEHTCAIRADSTLLCWGGNSDGQASPPSGSFSSVSAGGYHSCAIRTDRSVACWGANDFGQSSPPPGSFIGVSAGYEHSCGLRDDGAVLCWGQNSSGQASPPSGGFTSVSAGGGFSCGIRVDQSIDCWGDDGEGQTSAPGGNFSDISSELEHSCAIDVDGELSCWGQDEETFGGLLPRGDFISVAAGFHYACAVSAADGSLLCWGESGPALSAPPAGSYKAVSAGAQHTCALRSDNWVVCWGFNTDGQLIVPQTAPPIDLSVSPTSPGTDNSPKVSGIAEPNGATVDVYATADCSGDPVASGSAADFAAGIPVTVAEDSTTTFRATVATTPGTTSVCSKDSVTYVEDSEPPSATIVTNPAALTSSRSASFTYSSDDAGAGFECKLDSGSFSSCPPSGTDYSGLADGPHSFSVHAVDAAGNTGDADGFSWNVDTEAPVVTFTATPANSTYETSASFGFTAPGAVALDCTLDSEPEAPCGLGQANYSGLQAGAHTFTITATDAAGNAATESYGWTVLEPDAPTLTLLSKPQRASARGVVRVAELGCADGPCALGRSSAKVEVGKSNWRARIVTVGSVGSGQRVNLRIDLPKGARRALAGAGRGTATISLSASSANGTESRVSGKVRLLPPR
jgi:alpha-tubulin suppressor-like RCC1 family protein